MKGHPGALHYISKVLKIIFFTEVDVRRRRKWQPTPVFLPGESQGWGAWWAAVNGVAQSQTRLK